MPKLNALVTITATADVKAALRKLRQLKAKIAKLKSKPKPKDA